MHCAYTSAVEEILTFETFEGFKKQVTCETDNNRVGIKNESATGCCDTIICIYFFCDSSFVASN
jgi:hypothetical protein